MPVTKQQETRMLLEEMLKKDVIQPTNSLWASPIVLVWKKDGSMRFFVHYRKVNSITRDAYPLPQVDYTCDTLGGSRWFSTLVLLSGYWKVEAEPENCLLPWQCQLPYWRRHLLLCWILWSWHVLS